MATTSQVGSPGTKANVPVKPSGASAVAATLSRYSVPNTALDVAGSVKISPKACGTKRRREEGLTHSQRPLVWGTHGELTDH